MPPVPPAATPDHRTRQRLLEGAVARLSRDGLGQNLLDQAAADAGIPSDRARVFFRRDEEVILALYARFAADLEARVQEFPPGTVAERFHAVMAAKFSLLGPYRDALAALTAAMLDPRHELGVLNPQTEIIRNRVQSVFGAVVEGATDRPADVGPITRALYGMHLALMLLWCQDRSPGAPAATAALDLARDLFGFVAPFLALPEAAPSAARLDGIFGSLLAPPDDESIAERATAILRTLFRHRRLCPDAGPCANNPCPHCFALHLPKVKYFVRADRPLHLILPAFPAKSPSRRKTLGPLPDMAEEIALQYLQAACDELAALHPPGVRLTVCSDGHVFSDLVGVTDDEVTRYGAEIATMVDRMNLRSIDLFGMADLYEGTDFPEMRRRLVADYAQPLEQVEERARRFDHARSLFNGIHRFIFEEQADVHPEKSRTKLREECRGLAHRVIQHSDAWGRLLADCFPTALRLSIHPQNPHSEKIGILLGASDDAWLTPWHGAALKRLGGWTFLKRDAAEALGARLVARDGRGSYFETDNAVNPT